MLQILIWGVSALIVGVGLIAPQIGLSALGARHDWARKIGWSAFAFCLIAAVVVLVSANDHADYMSRSLY